MVRRPPLLTPLLLVLAVSPLAAQEPPDGGDLRVYLDCQTRGCDQAFIRSELAWVAWVRDRQVADVHILVTGQGAGGGGRRFTLDFLGSRRFAGEERHLVYASSGDATDDEVRRGLVERMGLGLVPFALETPLAQRLTVRAPGPEEEGRDRSVAPGEDPWDFWVFRVGIDGGVEGEDQQSSLELDGSVSANRTTEAWKLNAEVEYERQDERFELEDRTVRSLRENWNVQSFAVKSLGARWAAGLRAEAGRNSQLNEDFFAFLAPGLEYSVFPYDEFTRRAVTLQYLVGARYLDWERETIYGERQETRLYESLTGRVDFVQPWGQVDVNLTGSHYFHDLARWRMELGGRVEVRLFQGFSLNLGGRYGLIRDQLHIPAEELSDEEILLELQELATDYSYRTFFGLSYRFGSIFNTVVNPRFGGRFD